MYYGSEHFPDSDTSSENARKEQRKQEAAQNREMYMEKEQTTTRNKGIRNATPQRNAAKVSRSTGPGRK